ncbi:MAG TPA: FtsX-like permease family protein, partial [Frankiaceae bacterium]|nr:FtsX-like permease family protein [Frankiaceae bacterium]
AMTVSTDAFDRSFTTPGDSKVYVDLTGATGPGSRTVLADVLDRFTVARAHTLDGFITARQATIDTLLNLFSLLLALCVVVSVLGIVNTLTLSVIERTREIGMLRAIGMTRSQVRRMIHLESQVIAFIGALIGLLLGLLLAALTTGVLSSWNVGFSLSWAALGVVVAAAFLAGTLAGIEPARRAARLDPLTAIAYE